MASNKELVDAYAANRRRLVAAFVTGVADESGFEQPRPWRRLVIGLVLTLLLLAVAAAIPFITEAMRATT